MRYVVAFYELDRACGGPEEGGWWYNRYIPVSHLKTKGKQSIKGNNYSFRPLRSNKQANKFIKEFEKEGFTVYSEKQLHYNALYHMHYE